MILKFAVDNLITNIGEPINCTIIRRKNRFTVEIKLGEERELALLTNTGRLKDLIYEGNEALCLRIEHAKKLRYLLLGTKANEEYSLIDTRLQMKCFEIAQQKGMLSWIKEAKILKRNVKVYDSLLDYLLELNGEKIYLEIKSAVLFDGYYAMYPDCPSLRGRRHVEDLIRIKDKGGRAMLIFIAAHPLAKAFKPSFEGDPILSEKISEAYSKGVEIHAIKLSLKRNGDVILLDEDLALDIS